MWKTFLFQAIQFSQTVLIWTIQFSINMQFNSIQPVHRNLSGATILGQSSPGSNGSEGVLRIPQSSSITGTSPSDCLVSYPGLSLGRGFYPTAEIRLLYSTAPANWARNKKEKLSENRSKKERIRAERYLNIDSEKFFWTTNSGVGILQPWLCAWLNWA